MLLNHTLASDEEHLPGAPPLNVTSPSYTRLY